MQGGLTVLAVVAGVAILGAIVALAVHAAGEVERKRAEAWRIAGQRFGLSAPARNFWTTSANALEGRVDDLLVSVKGYGGKGANTAYEMEIPGTGLQITAEGFSSAIGRWIGGGDVTIGDPIFDRAAVIRGDTADRRALFDAQTRAAALRVLRLGGWVSDGKIQMRQSGLEDSAIKLEERLEAMVELARRIAWAHDVAPSTRLAAIAAGDPLPAVRRNALESLLERGRDRGGVAEDQAAKALATALEDPDADNRFFTAMLPDVSPAESRRVLLALVRESRTPDFVRAKAITALGRFDGIEDADATLDAVLDRGVNEARIAAIAAVALRQGHASRITSFAKKPHPPTRAAVASALGRIGTSADQPLLLEMLDDDDETVRLAAARSLGTIGSVGAVEKLRSLTGFLGGELSRAATDAIAAIQSRAAGAGAGQLSVSDAPASAGSLSQAAQEGALSDLDEPVPSARARKTPA